MKMFCWMFLFGLFLSPHLVAQMRTDETKTTVDQVTGDTMVTQTVIISEKEDITPRRHMFVINPLKFFLFYNITYFQQVSPSLGLGIGIQSPTIEGLDGFGVNAEARLYPSGKTLRGFYVAPNISYNHLSAEGASTEPFSIGVLVGWQWFPGKDFAMGLGIGIDHYTGTVKDDQGDFEDYSGKIPVLRFDIGYAW